MISDSDPNRNEGWGSYWKDRGRVMIVPKKYSVESKQRVVEAVIQGSRPTAAVAREYGLATQTLEGIVSRRIPKRTPNQGTRYRCPNEND